MLRELDGLVRGERTTRERLSSGTFELPLGRFVAVALVLGATYGFFMGWYAIARTWGTPGARDGWMQMFASMVKVPALFLCTLIVTFPSLYVFNALVGCRLMFGATLRLLVAAIVVHLAVAASLAPIVAFFTLSTTSYEFMVVLNIVMLGIGGFVGLGFLLKALRRLAEAAKPVLVNTGASPTAGGDDAASANRIFYVWVVIYGLVGAQMGWLMRPFIGHPGVPFAWFRTRGGSFFESALEHLRHLLSLQ